MSNTSSPGFSRRLSQKLQRIETALHAWSLTTFVFIAATVSLVLSLFMFAPSLWQFASPEPGSLVWARGLGYASQCVDPFRRDIEPALQWRLLPPLVAHVLGLRGWGAFALSWIGIAALLAYVARAAAARLTRRLDALFITTLVGTTSAVFTPTGWLGLNDGWLWLAVLAATFGRAQGAWPLACLLGPWIDERFLLGFPLIVVIRSLDRGETLTLRQTAAGALWLLPYVLARVALGRLGMRTTSADFLADQFHLVRSWLPLAPLGWWFGLRAGWMAVIAGVFATWRRSTPNTGWLSVALFLALASSTVLASDLSRSVAILLPALVFGAVQLTKLWPEHATRLLGILCVLNLLLPAAHVVYTHIQPISPLPVELLRLLH